MSFIFLAKVDGLRSAIVDLMEEQLGVHWVWNAIAAPKSLRLEVRRVIAQDWIVLCAPKDAVSAIARSVCAFSEQSIPSAVKWAFTTSKHSGRIKCLMLSREIHNSASIVLDHPISERRFSFKILKFQARRSEFWVNSAIYTGMKLFLNELCARARKIPKKIWDWQNQYLIFFTVFPMSYHTKA